VSGGVEGGKLGGQLGSHGDEVIGAGIAAVAPVVLARVTPEYPQEARRRRIEGQVLLRAIVDREGRVEDDVEVVQSVRELDEAAVSALRQWRFRPGRDGEGRAVRVRIEVPIRFQLR
jgi:protein TonB